MIGTTVSHYKILEKIGEGGMGEVYLAEDTKLRRHVALKFLPKELTKDEDRKQRFLQEARAAAGVQHPHIAAVYDVGEVDGRTFLAMEYIPGQSLRQAIASKELTSTRALELGLQIAEGLAKAHEKGVVHRDVKPENVLVSEDGYAKIIDFGLAKLTEPVTSAGGDIDPAEAETQLKTREGLVMGTVAYMSPEQAMGGALDARSDIFSLGVVLYEMLSGSSPFQRQSAVASLSALLKESPPPLTLAGADTPPALQEILSKALAKDPAERYPSMKGLASDLKALRDLVSRPSHPALAAASGRPSGKWKWSAIALLVSALVALGFYFGARHSGSDYGVGTSGRPAIAVMHFESMTTDEDIQWLSRGLPNMLSTDLAQTAGLDVVSSQRLQEISNQAGVNGLQNIDKTSVTEVARRAGAGAVVMGSIVKSGEEIRIDAQVEDVESGRILSAESVRGTNVFAMVDELTERIRAGLDVADRPAGRALAEITTSSLEAYRLYSEGVEAWRNLRTVDASRLFRQAVEIDPSFAMAYLHLSTLVPQREEREQYFARALAFQDKLPERQRLELQASNARRMGDFEKARELYETLVSRYPDAQDAYVPLSRTYEVLNRPDESLRALERGVEAVPSAGHLHNELGYELLLSGRYPEAIRELEVAASLSPSEANPRDSLGDAYLLSGQPEKAIERYRQALEMDPLFFRSHLGCAWAYGMLGRYEEAFEEVDAFAESLAAQGLPPGGDQGFRATLLVRMGRFKEAWALNPTLPEDADPFPKIGRETAIAGLAFMEKDYVEVVEAVDRMERVLRDVSQEPQRTDLAVLAHLLAGAAQARLGNLGTARDRLRAQSELDLGGDRRTWWHGALEGEIALAEGDLAAAEAAFTRGEPEFKMRASPWDIANALPFFRDGRARVKKRQGDLTGAIEIYRALNTPDIANKWTAMLEPSYVLELARLQHQAGNKEAARAEYQRFLELWKDADADRPELTEAKEYLAS